MASSSFTPNLGLCSWSENDKPKRIDFVSDNQLIDQVLGSHINDSDVHITPQEKQQLSNPYFVLEYAGDGESERRIELSADYTFAIVFQKFYPSVTKNENGDTVSHFAITGRLFGSSGEITLKSDCLIVTQTTIADSDGVVFNFNEENSQYVAILFK